MAAAFGIRKSRIEASFIPRRYERATRAIAVVNPLVPLSLSCGT
jgi:hypothetical protein